MIPKKIDYNKSLIIGIDCSGESFSTAVVKDGQCLAERGGFSPRSHLCRLFPSIKGALEEIGAGFSDVSAVAVTVGPGSFTGLRLGIVTARTIAQTTGCALVGINTLEALAAAHPGCPCLLAGLDARRGEVFASFFDTSDGNMRRLCSDKAYSPQELAEEASRLGCRLAVGSGALRYHDILVKTSSLVITKPLDTQVRGAWVASLGETAFKSGHRQGVFELAPVYLRAAEVQLG
ncbi:MAG: tRNA (adenosine(37)-N6)-threonylcarbamoyltransferase complex dimerization subunit type 1 TsaB [Candidatus Bruticola sp.]